MALQGKDLGAVTDHPFLVQVASVTRHRGETVSNRQVWPLILVRRTTSALGTSFCAIEEGGGDAIIHQATCFGASVAVLHITASTLALHAASGER